MFLNEEYDQIEEGYLKTLDIKKTSDPGMGFLKIMQYYSEEKELVNKPHTIKVWEKFIEKYFSSKIEMEIKIFENQILFHKIEADFDNLPYIYYHKNKSLFNKWIFMNEYEESIEKDEDLNQLIIINFKNILNVLEYKKNKVFIYLDSNLILNSELKFVKVSVKIDNIEIYDEVNLKSLNLFELKNHFLSLFSTFKNFVNVRNIFNFIFRI